MSQEMLRDGKGLLIGKLKKEPGVQTLYNAKNLILGTYNEKSNTTYDKTGKLVGRSNVLLSLLYR